MGSKLQARTVWLHRTSPPKKPNKAPKRLWIFLIGVIFTLVASGCRADIAVDVDVASDGSGTVNVELLLDEEAATAMVDLEGPGLALEDLKQSGWQVGETEQVDGGAKLSVRKSFGTAAQFAAVMQEVSGDQGLFKKFELERIRSFARVEYNVSGQIDTTNGLDSFADSELDDLLGITAESAASDYGASAEEVGIEFSVAMPGDVTEGETNGLTSIEDDRTMVRWAVDLAAGKATSVQATSETRTVSALVLRGLAVVIGVLAILLVAAQLLRQFGSDDRGKKIKTVGGPNSAGGGKSGARTKAAEPSKKPNSEDAIEAESPDEPTLPLVDIVAPSAAPPTTTGQVAKTPVAKPVTYPDAAHITRAVVLDGMGVLYKEGDDINKLLIPFVRERGSIKTNDEIWAKARVMSLGRLTTTQFWKDIGLGGDIANLDAEYVAEHQLSTGVVRYMRALRDHNVRVGCVVNGATAWAEQLRLSHSLTGLIDPWIVSGSVGVRKPEMPLLEVVRRLCELPPSDIRFVDDDLDILDVVRAHGYLTSWYNPEATAAEARGHSVIRSFEAEAARLSGLLKADDSTSTD